MCKILLMNGPNINLIGTREPEIYGAITLQDVELNLKALAKEKGVQLLTYQSNHEGDLVDRIHTAKQEGIKSVIINPGAYTHTSIAIRDAFLGVNIPFFEVHISNVFKREPFRHHSYLSDVAQGLLIGHGVYGYELALLSAIKHLDKN